MSARDIRVLDALQLTPQCATCREAIAVIQGLLKQLQWRNRVIRTLRAKRDDSILAIAKDCYPHAVSGGLTRTEHRPRKAQGAA